MLKTQKQKLKRLIAEKAALTNLTCTEHINFGLASVLAATLPTKPFKFFACPIMAYFRESLHESNTISVKHALHVVKIQF